MPRAQYHASIADFLHADDSAVLGQLVKHSAFAVEATQRGARSGIWQMLKM